MQYPELHHFCSLRHHNNQQQNILQHGQQLTVLHKSNGITSHQELYQHFNQEGYKPGIWWLPRRKQQEQEEQSYNNSKLLYSGYFGTHAMTLGFLEEQKCEGFNMTGIGKLEINHLRGVFAQAMDLHFPIALCTNLCWRRFACQALMSSTSSAPNDFQKLI
jgi:hypothetical protein